MLLLKKKIEKRTAQSIKLKEGQPRPKSRITNRSKAYSPTISLRRTVKIQNAVRNQRMTSSNSYNVIFATMLITGSVLLHSKACQLSILSLCAFLARTNLGSTKGSSTMKSKQRL